MNFHAATPQSRLCRDSSPYTVEPWDRAMTDFFNRLRAVPFGAALFICTQKTAPPTRCCNFTIHFSAFRRSGFLSDIYIISDLYKTVSVNLSDFLLRRTTVDAAQFGHLTVVIVFVWNAAAVAARYTHHLLAFKSAWRKAPSAEKFLIFCSAELSDKLWRAVGVLIFAFAVHRTRLQSFFECTPQVQRRPGAGSLLPLCIFIIAHVLDKVNIFFQHF